MKSLGPRLGIWLAWASLATLPAATASPDSPAAPGTDLVIEDPVGDAFPVQDAPTSTPVAAAYAYVDVTSLTLGRETTGDLELRIRFAGRPEPTTTLGEAATAVDFRCELRVGFEGWPTMSYVIFLGAIDFLSPGGPPDQLFGVMWGENRGSDATYIRDGGRLAVEWDAPNATVAALVPKALLPPFENNVPALGDALRVRQAECHSEQEFFLDVVQDTIGPGSESYRFREPPNGDGLYVHIGPILEEDRLEKFWAGDAFSPEEIVPLGLAPEDGSSFPVTVRNLDPFPRRFALSVRFLDGREASPTWGVPEFEPITLAAGENRTVDVFVDPPEEAVPGREFLAVVEAQDGSGGILARNLRPVRLVEPLTPERNTLHFFSRFRPVSDLDEEVVPFNVPAPWRILLSPSEEVADWGRRPVKEAIPAVGSCRTLDFDPLPATIRLDPEGEAEWQFHMTGPDFARANVSVEIYGGLHPYHWAGEFPVNQPKVVRHRLAADGPLLQGTTLQIYLCAGPAPGYDGVAFDPARSHWKIPILEVLAPAEPGPIAAGPASGTPAPGFAAVLAVLVVAVGVGRRG